MEVKEKQNKTVKIKRKKRKSTMMTTDPKGVQKITLTMKMKARMDTNQEDTMLSKFPKSIIKDTSS